MIKFALFARPLYFPVLAPAVCHSGVGVGVGFSYARCRANACDALAFSPIYFEGVGRRYPGRFGPPIDNELIYDLFQIVKRPAVSDCLTPFYMESPDHCAPLIGRAVLRGGRVDLVWRCGG